MVKLTKSQLKDYDVILGTYDVLIKHWENAIWELWEFTDPSDEVALDNTHTQIILINSFLEQLQTQKKNERFIQCKNTHSTL